MAQSGRTLGTMPVAMHTDLHYCFRHRESCAGKVASLNPPGQIRFFELRHPFRFPRMGFAVLRRDHVQRFRNLGFLFDRKVAAQAQCKPETIGQQNVVQKLSQFLILGCLWVLSDRFQEGGVRSPFVLNQIVQHSKHGAYFIKQYADEFGP